MTNVLYKREEAWGLPSISAGCIQAEALLRFTGTEFTVLIQTEPGRSPTGFHPAFEKDQILASTEKCQTEFDAVRQIYAFLKTTHSDPDVQLNPSDLTLAMALSRLIEEALEPATLYSAWIESEGFKTYKGAYSGRLQFPLDFAVAKMEQRRMRHLFRKTTAQEIYEKACALLDSVSHLLENGKGCLFGSTPCSADAFLYGHLLFYLLAPVVSPIIRRKIEALPNLKQYVEQISKEYFKETVPVLETVHLGREQEDEVMTSAWTDTTKSIYSWDLKKMWSELQKMDKASKWWLGSVSALLLVYAWFRPPFVIVMDHEGEIIDEDDID